MIELPGLWSLTPIGALLGVVATFYWLVVSGRLVPRSTHEESLGQERKRGDEWKETALEYREVNAEVRRQNGQLLEANRVVESFLRATTPPGTLPPEMERTGPGPNG